MILNNIQCHACGRDNFENYTELAQHIVSLKDQAHRKSKKWAHGYLLKVRKLNQKRDFIQRVPMTEEQREARRNLERDLSGDTERVKTYCPQCKTGGVAVLESEHTQNPEAWRVKSRFVVVCNACRG